MQRVAALPVNLPQLQVTIGGIQIADPIALELESIAYFAADRFMLILANGANMAFFASVDAQTINISISLGLGGYVSLITGQIDNVRINLTANTVDSFRKGFISPAD